MAGWHQNGTGYDVDERVQKVALTVWDAESLSWIRQAPITAADLAPAPVQTLFDKSGSTLYIGKAAPGALVSASAWAIARIMFDEAGFPSSIMHASLGESIARWDQRASLSYT
jgi:hypothetical protein